MLKLLQAKFVSFAGHFYAHRSGLSELKPLLSWFRRRLPKPPALFGIELLVAISLAVYYFFLVIPESAAPRQSDGNEMNAYLFTYLSDHPYSQKDIAADFTTWKARLAGPMLSGWEYDQVFKHYPNSADAQSYNISKPQVVFGGYITTPWGIVFGSYHAIWLFLLLRRL